MTTRRKSLDPNVRALLEEVASDPRSHLLRVPEIDGPIRFEAAVGEGAAFLNAAEREILGVHRDELAELLYDATRQGLLDHPRAASDLRTWVTVDRQVELPSRDELERHGRAQMAVTPDELRAEDAFAVLERCIVERPARRPSASQLATACLRLRPHDGARICLAIALHQEGRTQGALAVLCKVLDGRPSDLDASIAWEQVGNLQASLERFDSARSAMTEAARTLEVRLTPLMNLLATCIQLGDRAAILNAASLLDERMNDNEPSIEAFVEAQEHGRRVGVWTPTPASRRELAPIAERMPWKVRRLIDVFT